MDGAIAPVNGHVVVIVDGLDVIYCQKILTSAIASLFSCSLRLVCFSTAENMSSLRLTAERNLVI